MTRKIVVADDNIASRELIREVLEMSGYDVVEAGDGQDAVSCVREHAPDLLLVDIQMPRLDGYGVLRELRADARFSGLQVVALTAFAMQGDRERALDAGFDGYITKPVEIAALRQEIKKLL
ncbi:MAG TPA: response regulator [Bryobacteraceae bacterium]|nr:response regulator [Bryobacteraceae bacterium]